MEHALVVKVQVVSVDSIYTIYKKFTDDFSPITLDYEQLVELPKVHTNGIRVHTISFRSKTTSSLPVNFSWTLRVINSRWLELAT